MFWLHVAKTMAECDECYGFFKNEWNVSLLKLCLPEWKMKMINIYSKENITSHQQFVNYVGWYASRLTFSHKTYTLIITERHDFRSKFKVFLACAKSGEFMLSDNYKTGFEFRYEPTVYPHNATEHGYCDERELYATSQMISLLVTFIHEQQTDFTKYNADNPWNAIDYIFADSFIVKNMCGF